MMTNTVSLSGKFYSVVARGEMPHTTVLSRLQDINQQAWCPKPYNNKEAFIKACLDHRKLIAPRLSVIYGKRVSYLQIELKKHKNSSTNGYEWVYIDPRSDKNEYKFIASAYLSYNNGIASDIRISDDIKVCTTPAMLKHEYIKNLNTVSGGSVGKLLRRLGDCLESLGCCQYLSSGFFWISDKAPDHTHDNKHHYEAWFQVIEVLKKVSNESNSSLKIRCLDVAPDEDSYGMVADAIQDSIAKKVDKLQELFDLDKAKPESIRLSDRELKTKAKEVATITKQLQELDSRLNLGSLVSGLQSAISTAQQDCSILQSQAKSRMHSAHNVTRRRLTMSPKYSSIGPASIKISE